MNAEVTVNCTKYSAWFEFWCPECGARLGSSDDDELEHAATKKEGKLFRKVEVPIECQYAGMSFETPKILVPLTTLNQQEVV